MGRIKITDNEQTITNDVFIDLAYQEEISVAKHILQIDPDYIKLLGFIPTRIRKQINSDIDVRLEDATCTEGISIENAEKLYDWSGFYDVLTEADVKGLAADQQFLIDNGMMEKAVDVRSLILPGAMK